MELPHLGEHCGVSTCKRLDFLPMRCDACGLLFCKDHIHYSTHSCKESYKKDNQVPVCPLCNSPVPVRRGEVPDAVVGAHIDNHCRSDQARQKREKKNRCSASKCKQMELVPIQCSSCRKNFCVRHRHTEDHNCQGFQGTGRGVSEAGAAAILRHQPNSSSESRPRPSRASQNPASVPRNPQVPAFVQPQNAQIPSYAPAALQGDMNEEEAMQLALALSLADSTANQLHHLSKADKDRPRLSKTRSPREGVSFPERLPQAVLPSSANLECACIHCRVPSLTLETSTALRNQSEIKVFSVTVPPPTSYMNNPLSKKHEELSIKLS